MEKIFIKIPPNRVDKIIFCIYLSAAISEREITKKEVLEIFKNEGIEIDKLLKNKLIKSFPNLNL